MNKQKYTYDFEVLLLLRQIKSGFEVQGFEVDTRYIDYYGDICPRCQSGFKVYGNEVKDVASISSFLITESKKAVVYCVCKKCVKELSRLGIMENDARKTEATIFEKIPDLKRSDDDPISLEEQSKEIDILSKIFDK